MTASKRRARLAGLLYQPVCVLGAAGALVCVRGRVGAGMILANLLFHHAAMLVATDAAYGAFGARGSDGLVLLLLDLHDHGYALAGVFFGLWLLPLGFLSQ